MTTQPRSWIQRLSLNGAAALFAAAALPPVAIAAQAVTIYPTKPIRLVIPFPPGGGNDIVGRLLAERLGERLGQPVIADNRGGASTIIAADLIAHAPTDGYTLMLGPNTTLAVIPNLRPGLPYDPLKDFEPVSLVARSTYLLVAHPAAPFATVKELIAQAKARPGQINFASPGAGTSNHLAGEMFKQMAGINLTHVPYKGTGPAVSDLLGGHVPLMFASLASVRAHVAAGKLRGLGVSTAKRNPSLPDMPTIAESGVPGYHSNSWSGVIAPRGTPPVIITRLNSEIVGLIRDSDARQRLSAQGFDLESSTPQEFGKYIRAELARYGKIIKAAGIKLD
jgi:tripartite-type tricarboxylate transporter receptor subunit TctC